MEHSFAARATGPSSGSKCLQAAACVLVVTLVANGGHCADPSVAELVAQLRGGEEQTRLEAVFLLGEAGSAEALDPLIKALADPAPYFAYQVCEALGMLGDSRVAKVLVAQLRGEREPSDCQAVARALVSIGDRSVVPDLLALLRSPREGPRQAAVTALGDLRVREAWEPLLALARAGERGAGGDMGRVLALVGGAAMADKVLEGAKSAEDPAYRGLCLEVLALLRTPGADRVLQQALSDRDPQVRQHAVRALAVIGGKWVVPLLIQRLDDRASEVRYRAAEALGKTGDPRAVVPLIRLLKRTDVSGAMRVIPSLGALGDRRAVPVLLSIMNREDVGIRPLAHDGSIRPAIMAAAAEHVRQEAVRALARLREPKVIPELVRALRQDGPSDDLMSACYLGFLKAKAAVPELVAALRSGKRSWVSESEIILALVGIGDPAAVPAIAGAMGRHPMDAPEALAMIGDERAAAPLMEIVLAKGACYLHRHAAGRALAKCARKKHADRLYRALGSSNWQERAAAAIALAGLKEPRAVPLMAGMLKSNVALERMAAAEALGSSGCAVALAPLLRALNDPNPQVRREAARGLGRLGNRGASQHLITALRDRAWQVRAAAGGSLGTLRAPGAVKALEQLLSEHRDTVISAALHALRDIGTTESLDALERAAREGHVGVQWKARPLVRKRPKRERRRGSGAP